ncbi:MAG: Hsp20/alpha crystallin family protein [Spirochaetaceae bacterium]|jgi:HSP20 family molecular chaperone IbpA|nr:Hsp20/alpha crystallin family protein [Spirochaetaceae bacterium]
MQDNYSFDMREVFEDLMKAAQNFQWNPRGRNGGGGGEKNANEYSEFASPPANILKRSDGTLVFQFALAGFSEADIDLSFQGDSMVLSARHSGETACANGAGDDNGHDVFLRRDMDFRPVENRSFNVPADEYDQEKVAALFKNGLLTVSIPPKTAPEQKNKVRIEFC